MWSFIAFNTRAQCHSDLLYQPGLYHDQALSLGVLYLTAEQRYMLRSAPEAQHDEALANGTEIKPRLLELLIELAGIAVRAPYEETAYEACNF